jgi:2-polyprenyl-3-methyl-5-hydroxy-6-metoxy-1,4-benzoquinol methylase
MMNISEGGYDEGYRAVPCFWGIKPGSLISVYLAQNPEGSGVRILDIGCGEGKNAAAFAQAGYIVDAIDCSAIAISNGKKLFDHPSINWRESDVRKIYFGRQQYEVVIAYGLFHCLRSLVEISALIDRMKHSTRAGGYHLICTFNSRSQDLRGHPGFNPTLAPHAWYLDQYAHWTIVSCSDADINEVHPHNNIAHHHSMTRLIARRPL